MCNYKKLEFNHFVVITSDGTIFGCAKENGHTYNFLIHRESIRTQHGDQWLELDAEIAQLVRARMEDAYTRSVPTYRTHRFLMD